MRTNRGTIVETRTVDIGHPLVLVRSVAADPVDLVSWNPHVLYFVTAGAGEPPSAPQLRGRFLAVERVGGKKFGLEYRILRQETGRVAVLAGHNRFFEQVDVVILRELEDGGTRITRQIQLTVRALGYPLKGVLETELPAFVEAGTREIARRVERALGRAVTERRTDSTRLERLGQA